MILVVGFKSDLNALCPDVVGGRYVALKGSNPEVLSFLDDAGFSRINPSQRTPKEREQLLLEYRNAMDALAAANGECLSWWSTDIASKNRSNTLLPEYIDMYLTCVEAINSMSVDETLVIVGAPWPVVRGLSENHVGVMVPSEAGMRRRYRWRGRLESWARLVRDTWQVACRIWHITRCFKEIKGLSSERKPLYLIKSFAYQKALEGKVEFEDQFFGDFACHVREEGSCTPLTLVLSFGDPVSCGKLLSRFEMVVPIEHYLSVVDPFVALIELGWTILRRRFTPGAVLFNGSDLSGLVDEVLLSGGWSLSLLQHLHRVVAMRCARQHTISRAVYTFEGNPWERQFVAGLRMGSSSISILGYQHSVIAQDHVSVYWGPEEYRHSPRPDVVLTSGVEPAEMIVQRSVFPRTDVVPTCALRYAYFHDISQPERAWAHDGLRVLVALEGLWEAIAMVEYVLDQAEVCPDVTFRFRAHPGLPLDCFLERLGREPGPNIERSLGGHPSVDIAESDIVIYSRTTMALEAALMGRLLIFFSERSLMSYDPLFSTDEFKWTVSQSSQLKSTLAEIQSLGDDEREMLIGLGKTFVHSYFHRIDKKRLQPFFGTYGRGEDGRNL